MVDLTYRTTGTWGPGKGANLLPTEVDTNFWNVAQALVDLETNPAQPVGIESITMSGSQMTIHLTDGSVMGPFLIPVLTFTWRGEWQPTTSYAELDVFSKSDTGIFLTLLAHTSGAVFDPDIQVDPGGGPAPALQKLFGATDGTLDGLSDVQITSPTNGQLLQYDGSLWVNVDLGASEDGVISVSAGTGLAASPNPIIDSGTISFAPISDKNLLANTLGSSAAPIPHSLTQFLDAAASFNRGSVLVRNSTGWTALGPGTSGQYLKTNGSGSDAAWDSPAGSGTVISVSAGPGISTGGAPITSSGTVSLAPIADKTLLANISGVSAAPSGNTLTALIDAAISATQGSVLYRGGSAWSALAPGTAGQVLATGGPGANPSWSTGGGGGGITQLTGDVTAGPGSGSQAATLANTAVTPGSYTAANITVDAKGRITAAANGGAGSGDVTGPAGAASGNVATFNGTTGKIIQDGNTNIADLKKEAIQVAVSDETTNLTTGTAKLTFRMPYAMTLTVVRASLSTASSSGLVTVDVKESGASIFSTGLSIDATEKTSTTAATAAVISDTALADDAEITIDITGAGTGARGLKVTLIGTRA